MHWIVATLVSAALLGCYDLFTKHAVRENAVLPVLFLANVCSAALWLALMAMETARPGVLPPDFIVASLRIHEHGPLALKSAIVAASWVCAYFAFKHLPVSIAAPIRATGPIWILLGALVFMGERPTGLEIIGIATTLLAFFGLSVAGAREGIHFHRDKWVGWLFVSTLLNAVSALYDKYLLGDLSFAASTVQAWFSIYLVLLFLPLAIGWKLRWWPQYVFRWRWSIPLLSAALLISDFIYFSALRDPEALISVVSSLRRASTLVAFAGGLLFFGETNGLRKLPAVLGVVVGIVLTILG